MVTKVVENLYAKGVIKLATQPLTKALMTGAVAIGSGAAVGAAAGAVVPGVGTAAGAIVCAGGEELPSAGIQKRPARADQQTPITIANLLRSRRKTTCACLH